MKNLVIIILLSATFIFADVTIPAGNVSGIWTQANSPYFIDGEIIIQLSDNLTIQPGVDVIFNGHYKFIINGKLLAQGTPADSILFTVADTTGFSNIYSTDGGWHGLRFMSCIYNGQGNSKLEHCRIEYAKSSFDYYEPYADRTGGGIYINLSSNLEITNCEISNNMANYGGGIYCWASNPILSNLTITDNFARSDGGGMMFTGANTNPTLENSIISGNSCYNNGGGIYCASSSAPILNNIIISENTALGGENEAGGGISCWGAFPTLNNVTIIENFARYGGGIECNLNSVINFTNGIISNNVANWKGGGIMNCAEITLSGVTICENTAENEGGGITFYSGSETIFDPDNLCNIYHNNSINSNIGHDLYSNNNQNVDVIVDTFTVLYPNNQYAYPLENFNFDILNCKIEQIVADLYVNPAGSDENSGLIPEDPLLTVTYALSIIAANSFEPHTIHLANGTYSPSITGEIFPIECRSYISISGDERDLTILDAEETERVLNCYYSNSSIQNLTVTNGYSDYGGGIYISSPNCYLGNVKVLNNTASSNGGGIYCYGNAPIIEDVIITSNFAENYGGGGIYLYNSDPTIKRSAIINNLSDHKGGGIFANHSDPTFIKTVIANNVSDYIGGGVYATSSDVNFENVTIVNNSSDYGGGIYSNRSNSIYTSTITWNNSPQEIYFDSQGNDNLITISYSDIMGGEAGIITNNNGIVNWFDGNIDLDPLFADSLYGDYHLTGNSPCIDAGSPYQQPDPDGTRADMGAYYFHHTGGSGEVWANFSANSTVMYMTLPVNFNDASLAFNTVITSWQWDFENDGIIDSYEQNPVYCYPDTGFYSVSLTVDDDIGNSHTMTKTDYIAVHPPAYYGYLWNIHPDGSDELGNGSMQYPFATIQHGISTAANSDTVLVHPGTYQENINYNGKNIIVGSLYFTTQEVSYISQTVIDGNANGTVVTFESDEDSTAVLCGFTIMNGSESGLVCDNANPKICNNVITQNTTDTYGAGLLIKNFSSPILKYLEISSNVSTGSGGGMAISSYSSPSLQNVTITNNESDIMGGGLTCYLHSNTIIENSIFWNNEPEEIFSYSDSLIIAYSDIQDGWEGEGNINEDPLFVDSINGDFHLLENSPCIDAGNPFHAPDPDSTRADIGAYYSHHVGSGEVYASFYANITAVCVTSLIIFNDASVAFNTEITSWQWDFDNDGTIDSYEQNPVHYYQNVGFYSVSLTVEDDIGNSHTMTKTDYITVHPWAYFGHLWHISPEGSDVIGNGSLQYPFATIQHGINATANNDTVLVQPGTYQENINYNEKNIIVGSLFYTTQDSSYVSQTVIDGNANGTVVKFVNIEDSTATLCGFTIINGSESGIICDNASPSIHHNVITENSTNTFGAGILISNSSDPILNNLLISSNISNGNGGGLGVSGYSNPHLYNITIANNESVTMIGGLMCYLYSNPIIVNSIFWNNEPEEIYSHSDSIVIVYSNIENGWDGEGNIDEDPLFVDPENGDFNLTENSPCVDAGTAFFEWNEEVILDLEDDEYYGNAPDMGAFESEYITSVDIPLVPLTFGLKQNFPNPFNPDTKIQFSVPVECKVELAIYNIKGQKVKQLVDDHFIAGKHSAVWNGRDENGKPVSSGIYFYKIKAKNNGKNKFTKVHKMMMLK